MKKTFFLKLRFKVLQIEIFKNDNFKLKKN